MLPQLQCVFPSAPRLTVRPYFTHYALEPQGDEVGEGSIVTALCAICPEPVLLLQACTRGSLQVRSGEEHSGRGWQSCYGCIPAEPAFAAGPPPASSDHKYSSGSFLLRPVGSAPGEHVLQAPEGICFFLYFGTFDSLSLLLCRFKKFYELAVGLFCLDVRVGAIFFFISPRS